MNSGDTVFVIVLLIGIAVLAYIYLPQFLGHHGARNTVIVSGIVMTSIGTSPYNITFISQTTRQVLSTTINSAGRYAISLLGNDTYIVVIYYGTVFGKSTSSNCSSTLTLNGTVTAFNFSKSC